MKGSSQQDTSSPFLHKTSASVTWSDPWWYSVSYLDPQLTISIFYVNLAMTELLCDTFSFIIIYFVCLGNR